MRRGNLNVRSGIAFRARAPMSGPFAPLSCNKREDALSDGMEQTRSIAQGGVNYVQSTSLRASFNAPGIQRRFQSMEEFHVAF
ncbi:hypothetical protein [Paraburkholderia terrae]|uniref:Uncharacterized protein n=1 Tax=Paraburkholderia terrae TaxID=311230 RepID=A0A2I8EIJ2_9BURK|nr:hypothetical protein [Paraburkholderia terrae]AUT59320.1 hypothetical protein C2L65_06705 [Paraburkholderia terrae]